MNSLKSLRQSLPFRALELKGPKRGFTNAPKADHTAVRITGGIGDLILGLGLAECLDDKLMDVKVYSKWPGIVPMFSNLPSINEAELLENGGLDFVLSVNSMAQFQFSNNFETFHNPFLNDIYLKYVEFKSQNEWEYILDSHPILDNLMGIKAVEMGFNRESIGYACLGLPFKPLAFHSRVPRFSNLRPNKYITIHDGFDENVKGIERRSTKNWSMDLWKTTVKELKISYRDYQIVQLGGANSRHIPGVDIDLVGALSFAQSMHILEGSKCHIDGDSGLVHAAKVFGVPSVVLFGPTNHEFFGYSQNINLKGYYCGGCWWLKENWMAKCCLGFEVPECMDSIVPANVLVAVSKVFGRTVGVFK